MGLAQVVEELAGWVARHRLEEDAVSAFDQWLQSRGGSIGGFFRADIQAQFHEQSLLFRAHHPRQPVIVTTLALAVYGGDCPLGTFRVLTSLEGRRSGIEVELGAEVPLEGLDGHTWRFYE